MTDAVDRAVHVIQGDFAISDRPHTYLTTVLGSCVAVCLHDPARKIGGLNHFLLPGGSGDGQDCMRYGAYAMELLINSLLKQGAERHRLVAKVFGGARMTKGLRDIGGANAEFAETFLKDEGIPVIAGDLRGDKARRVRFWPANGAAKLLLVDNAAEIPAAMPSAPKRPVHRATPSGEQITLF